MTLDLDTLGPDDFPGTRDLRRQLEESRLAFLAMLVPARQDAPGSRAAPPASDAAGPSDPSAEGKP